MRSKGSVLLARCGETHEEIAARTRAPRVKVTNYIAGKLKPGKSRREVFLRLYKIPESAWDEPAGPLTRAKGGDGAFTPPPPTGDEPPVATVTTRIAQLQAMVDELVKKSAEDVEATPREKLMVLKAATETTALIGKLTGESQEISEARILRLPAWRRVEEAIVRALDPWPDALRAIGAALKAMS